MPRLLWIVGLCSLFGSVLCLQPTVQHVAEMVVTRGSSMRGATATEASIFARVAQTFRELPMAVSKLLVSLQYVMPSASLWNITHVGHVKDGGVWHYSESVEQNLENFIDTRHPSYESAWDVACNLGIFLERLAVKHPKRKFYGSDISTVMVNATMNRCPTCVAEVFDVNELQSPEFRPVPGHLPQPVDIVIVADVLYYIAWGGWPPIMNYVLPTSWTRVHRQTFWRHLTSLARKEVIFSGHQGNKAVTQYLMEMGATFMAEDGVWVTPGMSGKIQINGEQHATGVGYPGLCLLCAFAIAIAACAAYKRKTSK